MSNQDPSHELKLTRIQRKHILTWLDQHPLFRLAQKLEQRMSGQYELDRDEVLAAIYSLRLAMHSEQFDGRSKVTLLDVLNALEEELGLELTSKPS